MYPYPSFSCFETKQKVTMIFYPSDQSSCILRTVHGGRISIISALKGYVASPCFYTLTSRVCDEDDGNYFILGRIVSIQPKEDAFTKRVHLTCLCKLTTNKEGQLGCHSCEMYDLLEKSHKSYNVSKALIFMIICSFSFLMFHGLQ